MGSWSETCFATHLPIHEGGCRIVAIPVVTMGDEFTLRAVRSGYLPVGPPVRGVYDTYGGIDIDAEDLPLLAPLIEEVKKVNRTLSHDKKDEHRSSLNGIGVAEFNRDLHEGEDLDPEDIGSYPGASTTRTRVYCGDSAWLRFPVDVFPEDAVGPPLFMELPVTWCFMLEEVYDHFLSYPYGKGYFREDANSIRTSIDDYFDYFDSYDADPADDLDLILPKDLEGLDPEVALKYLDHTVRRVKLYNNFFSKWAEDVCRVTSFKHLSIHPYMKKGISPEIRARFFDLMALLFELRAHRIVLGKSTGPQFGQWRRHQKLHTLCGKIIREEIKDYKTRNGETYKDYY